MDSAADADGFLSGLDDDEVIDLCAQVHGERTVQAVNFNSPAQVVISGHRDAIETVMQRADEVGAKKCIMLPVSVPNHSRLMEPAVEPLAAKIDAAESSEPAMPVVQNNDVVYCDSRAAILASLRQHVVNPVYWTRTIQCMQANGVEAVIELGPGKVLTGLCKRIDRRFPSAAVEDPASLQKALDMLATD